MNIIILNEQELKSKIQGALTKKLSCIYRQKELQIMRVNNLSEFVLNNPIQEGVNLFSCLMNVRVRIGELEEMKCLKTLSASFTIENDGELSINEPLFLLDC